MFQCKVRLTFWRYKQCHIKKRFHFSILTLGVFGVWRNLISALSQAFKQYSPTTLVGKCWSKNLTNKRRGCTWKYVKKASKYGQYCIGKLFLFGKPVYREITYVYTATNCGDVNGYKCHSNFLTVVSKIKPKCYFFGLTCSVLFALFERT